MARRNTNKRELNSFEQKIIDFRGKNKLKTIVLLNMDMGVYTYRGEVRIIKDGMDIDFAEFTLEEQEKITNEVINENWEVNESYVG